MKDKKKVIALSGAILAIAATIGIGTWIGSSKNNDTVIFDEEQVESSSIEELPLVSEDGVNLTMTEENLSKIEKFMNSAGDMRITKTLTSIKEDKNTNEIIEVIKLDQKMLCYYLSDGMFVAIDPSDVSNDPQYLKDGSNYKDIFEKHKLNIEEHFGIDLETLLITEKNYNIMLEIAKIYNIDTTSFVNCRLDKEIYDIVYATEKQKLYYCDVTKNFDLSIMGLTQNDYDKILDTRVHLLTDEINGNEYISYLVIRVIYEKDDMKYTRDLEFTLFFFGDDMEGCNCADDSGCNTGTNDPCEEDCEMEDKIE